MTSYKELYPRLATARRLLCGARGYGGRRGELLVDLDALIPGFVSEFDGSVSYAASDTPKAYSVVDEVARRALLTGAYALAARREELPLKSPLVVILRYPFGVARERTKAPRDGG